MKHFNVLLILASLLITLIQGEATKQRSGALAASFNITSVDNMVKSLTPLVAYYGIQNKTFDVSVDSGDTWLYNFMMSKLHVSQASGFTKKSFKEIDGTDLIELELGGIDIAATLDADLVLFHFFHFRANQVNLTDLGINLKFKVDSHIDGVHFRVLDTAVVTLGGLDLGMENYYLNAFVRDSEWIINSVAQYVMPKIGTAIEAEIASYSRLVSNEGPYTFVTPLTLNLNGAAGSVLPLNLTMTRAPTTSDGLIQLYFDGGFDMPEYSGQKEYDLSDIEDYPARVPDSNSQQFWMHEDTLDSLFQVASQELFPLRVTSPAITDQLLEIFYEIRKYYGSDVQSSLSISMKPTSTKPITLRKSRGIVLGENGNLEIMIDIFCSNSTTRPELGVSFDMNLVVEANVTFSNFEVYPKISKIEVTQTNKTFDRVGLYAHDFDALYSEVLQNSINDINMRYENGWPLQNLDPIFGLLNGVMKDTTISPYVEDHWLYAGFSMQADKAYKVY